MHADLISICIPTYRRPELLLEAIRTCFLQDYRPLAESLEWELGQEYLRRRGSLAFIGDHEPVPFVVNNDGNLSDWCWVEKGSEKRMLDAIEKALKPS